MQEKFKDKGVVLVALTDEPMQAVARVAASTKINYIVGGQAAPSRGAYGCRAFPTIYVIGPDGKIVSGGSDPRAAEAAIEQLLKDQPPKVAKSVATRYAEDRISKADGLIKGHQDVEALHEFQRIVEDFGDAPVGKVAAQRIEAMKSNPKLAEMILKAEALAKHQTRCTKLLHLARALANAGHGGQAVHYYDQVTQDCDDTEFAKLAFAERASLNTVATPADSNEHKTPASQ